LVGLSSGRGNGLPDKQLRLTLYIDEQEIVLLGIGSHDKVYR
jgi:hypothetical protein